MPSQDISPPLIPEENQQKRAGVQKPNLINYLNIIGYIINFLCTFGVGTLTILPGAIQTGEQSDKYQTIVTPAGTAFSIWGLIFIAQAIFAIAQFLPRFRYQPALQEGLKYWYFLVCIAQALWTFFFSYDLINLSLVAIVVIWACLVCAVVSQYYCKLEKTYSEFWILRFPFMIHCGWLSAATALNVNVVIVNVGAAASVQLTSGIISLAVLHAIAVISLWVPKYPNYVIPSVLVWANYWIGNELQDPKEKTQELFGSTIINAIKNAGFAVAVIILIQIFVRAGIEIYQRKIAPKILETSSECTDEEVAHAIPADV